MRRLIICGDSFMSPRLQHPKKHFSEIFAEHLDFDLVCYSRSGFSNGGISIQIETAIQDKPDLILFNTTNSDRIEFHSGISEQTNSSHPFSIKNLGDTNNNSQELSDPFYTFDESKTLVSANLNGLLSRQADIYWENLYRKEMTSRFPDWEDKLDSIAQYLTHLYSERWKQQTDRMIMYTTLHRLHLSNIPYIFVHDWLGLLDSAYHPYWLESKNDTTKLVDRIRMNATTLYDPGFHLTYEDSQKVAELLIGHYRQHFLF